MNLVLQIGHATVMARLLAPEHFGQIATAMAFLRFGTFIAQIGVGQALIQAASINVRTVRTAATFSVLLGLTLTLAAYLVAGLTPLVSDAPGMVQLTQALSLLLLASALGMTPSALLARDLRFRDIAVIEVLSYAFGYVAVGISLAVAGFGVWSLVGAAITQAMLKTILSTIITRPSLLPLLDSSELRALLSYGSRFSVLQLLAAAQHAATVAAIGRFVGTTTVGLYDRGKLLVTLPFEKAEASITRVLFPAAARAQSDESFLRRAVLLHARIVSGVALPALVGMAVSAGPLVDVLLGRQWSAVKPIVPFVSAAVAFSLLAHFFRVVCDAQALMGARIRVELLQAVLLVSGLIAFRSGGLNALLCAVAVSLFVQYVLYARLVTKRLQITTPRYLRALGPGISVALLIGLTLTASNAVADLLHVGAVPSLAVQVSVGLALLIITFRSALYASVRTALAERLGPNPKHRLLQTRTFSVILRALAIRYEESSGA